VLNAESIVLINVSRAVRPVVAPLAARQVMDARTDDNVVLDDVVANRNAGFLVVGGDLDPNLPPYACVVVNQVVVALV